MRSQLLKGRLILDCSALLPGPFIGKIFAAQGARVVKIENPTQVDGSRRMGGAYQDLNEEKEIVPLNLKDPLDREKFQEWVRKADGLIEGFRPQAKKRLGLDEETLLGINPRLCIVSMVGYPEDSTWKDRAGHDINFAATTGCISLFKEMPALPLADLFGAYEGAFALAAALDSVARGKPGTRVVVSFTETLVEVQSVLIREYRESGKVPAPEETLFSGKYPCYRLYQAKDGRRISVGAIETKFWQVICGILGVSHLKDQGYAEGQQGKQTIKEVQAAFASKPWSEWAPLFANTDCCVEPVLDYSEVYNRGL